jgi:hypothetical protein
VFQPQGLSQGRMWYGVNNNNSNNFNNNNNNNNNNPNPLARYTPRQA